VALKDRLRSRTARDLRAERDELGFIRQPEVRWLSPGLLAKSGVEVAVSAAFGKFADKREIQRDVQDKLDYSTADELWIDYLSDTGDGWNATYTMAWLLAQESLDFDGEQLPRAPVLLLGGDEVYPLADPIAYENRFKGPFAAALPATDAPDRPHLYALPGNHDWYDGLASFLRVFCSRDGHVGNWLTRQRRSYFALKLPHDWWVWGIDIQLDAYIDDVQLDYFRGQEVKQDDKVILLTAKPSWVKSTPGRIEPSSWRYLSFFEERFVRACGARLVLTLSGDLHHYARYEPVGEGAEKEPTRITAGGGGAYLSATHTLDTELELRSLDRPDSVTYTRDEIYPCEADSRRLGNGILKLARLNPSFAGMIGAIYALFGIAMLGAVNAGEGPLLASADERFIGFLARASGGISILLMILLLGGIFAGVDIKARPLEGSGATRLARRLARFGVAVAQTAVHVLLAAVVTWAVLKHAPDIWHAASFVWIVSLVLLFGVGSTVGATVFGIFLFIVHKLRGSKAPENANQVFSGQSIPDYKNLLRMRLRSDGSLTIYPLGVDRVGRDWQHVGSNEAKPRFEPGGTPPEAPKVHPIDVPLKFDATGRRAY
jgi:hypothetical protein